MAAAIRSVATTFDVDAAWRCGLISGLASRVVPAPQRELLVVQIVSLAHGDTEPISASMIALRWAGRSDGVPGQRHEPLPSRSKGGLAELFGLDFGLCKSLLLLADFVCSVECAVSWVTDAEILAVAFRSQYARCRQRRLQ